MPTECSQNELDLGMSGGRRLVGAFDGGAITSNGGVVLLAAADRAIGLSRRLSRCFTDLRLADAVRHSVPDLLRQRIFGLALGHEDLIDHDALRDDPAFTAALDNSRLVAKLAPQMRKAKRRAERTGQPAREFADFQYRTRKSWSAKRRVIGKAEHTNGEANPRFIVTNIHVAIGPARFLSEDVYCQRGEMENRLTECQGDLFADRTPAPTMRANQLRLWLSSFACVLMCAVRRIGLAGTKLAAATCGTIRLKLLKIGALVTTSARRVKLALASACPEREVFELAARRL
ncbi:MAG: transposase [Hyphomicrobium sp.]